MENCISTLTLGIIDPQDPNQYQSLSLGLYLYSDYIYNNGRDIEISYRCRTFSAGARVGPTVYVGQVGISLISYRRHHHNKKEQRRLLKQLHRRAHCQRHSLCTHPRRFLRPLRQSQRLLPRPGTQRQTSPALPLQLIA